MYLLLKVRYCIETYLEIPVLFTSTFKFTFKGQIGKGFAWAWRLFGLQSFRQIDLSPIFPTATAASMA